MTSLAVKGSAADWRKAVASFQQADTRRFHHIHHLSPRIANYNLEACHNSSPIFQSVPPITLRSSLKSLSLRLWDERSHRLVGFSVARQRRAEQPKSATS